MPYISPFSTRRKQVVPSSNKGKPLTRTDFRGLDLSSPYDVVKENRSPFARNFRIYADEADSRKVAVSSRKGSGRYLDPLLETVDQQNTSTTGAADKTVGVLTEWKAMKYTAGATGPLTKLELRLKNTTTASGPIVVRVYSNNAGVPGDLLAESGILGADVTSSYAYVPVRFIEAPSVTNAAIYWIVAFIQDDGIDSYKWSSNTSTTLALTSNSTGSSWATTTYSLNFKAYISSTAVVKGATRYAPTSSVNKTILPIGTAIYQGNDGTGALTSILSGQNSSATDYNFTYADNKLFWVNGYDPLTTWDGTIVTDNSNLATNGTFEVNVTGWTGGTGTTVTRTTSAGEFKTGVAGMKLVGSGGNPAVSTFAITYEKGKQYTLSIYVKGTASQLVYPRAQGILGTAVTLTGGWDLVTYTFIATADTASTYGVQSGTNNATIYVDDVTLNFTGIRQVLHSQLPVLKLAKFHKNRFFGVSADDPNKLIWSEEPGNDDGAGKFWYEAYLSTSYSHVPVSKASDPIVAIIPFQDNLFIFTRTGKYILYGSDPGSFTIREATGKQGAISQKAMWADENYIYFASHDGFYRFNGSKDEIMTQLVQNEYADIADLDKVVVAKWNRQIRIYYPTSGSSVNDRCLIWHTVFEEWMLDTDAFVSYAVPWTDGDDDYRLVEVDSKVAAAHLAEQDYNNLGKAIDFKYYCKADSMMMPAVKKRMTKFFPILEGDGGNYPVNVGVDKDLANDTSYTAYNLTVGGARIGEFSVGDGTVISALTNFKPKRFRVSGHFYYGQVRIERKAINNRVRFIGYQLAIRMKRL